MYECRNWILLMCGNKLLHESRQERRGIVVIKVTDRVHCEQYVTKLKTHHLTMNPHVRVQWTCVDIVN